MGRMALISDLHANLEALEAVLDDIAAQGDIAEIRCLGDIVGYGPDPAAVIERVRSTCAWSLMGNHDDAVIHMPLGFNRVAANAIACQRQDLEPGIFSTIDQKDRWLFLQNLPTEKRIGADLFVHASPRDPIYEYILPDDPIRNPEKMTELFTFFDRHCFVGHTHHPGVFTEAEGFRRPDELGGGYRFEKGVKAIFNISSLGQPRDRDPRAVYAILEDEALHWRRVRYAVNVTAQKIYDDPCLDDVCGRRLIEGR